VGEQLFHQEPHSPQTVGWHQDAYYWPMAPHNSVTVWLAFDDVDERNGAMQIIPGSHRAGPAPPQALREDRFGA
jgi:ectoine hydroxylase-related dioxygenase (phytanoyl-CoA dioxygenase family)